MKKCIKQAYTSIYWRIKIKYKIRNETKETSQIRTKEYLETCD